MDHADADARFPDVDVAHLLRSPPCLPFLVRHACMGGGALPRFSGPSPTALPQGKASNGRIPHLLPPGSRRKEPSRPGSRLAISVNAGGLCGAKPAFPAGASG